MQHRAFLRNGTVTSLEPAAWRLLLRGVSYGSERSKIFVVVKYNNAIFHCPLGLRRCLLFLVFFVLALLLSCSFSSFNLAFS